MVAELDPETVARRLATLARLYVPETPAEGRARLRRELSADPRAFAARVERHLAELRALDELTRYLQAHRQ
jgi:hypothetical protein